MKILAAGVVLDKNWFGGEPLIAHMVACGLKERGFRVITCTKRWDRTHGLGDILRPGYNQNNTLNFYLDLIYRERPDVVLGFYDYDCSLYSACLKLKVPVVASVNIYWPLCHKLNNFLDIKTPKVCLGKGLIRCVKHMSNFNFSAKTILSNTLRYIHFLKIYSVLSKTQAVVVPSLFLKSKLIQAGYKNIQLVPYGINLDNIKPNFWQDSSLEKLILYPCGYGCAAKGIHHFSLMAKKLKRHFDKIQFIALGYSGDEYVQGLPRVSNAETIELMKKAYTVVIPPLWEEVFGITVIEAMAAGKPVVAYGSGGISEIICDGETGFLVPTGNVEELTSKIKYLIENEEIAVSMGIRGREKVKQCYSSEMMLDGYKELLLRIKKE